MKKLKVAIAGSLMLSYVAAPLSALAAEKKAKPYPLETCIVSDEELGSMGKPYVFTHEGQEIKMCCKSCEKSFKKSPAKYLKKLEKADKK